MSLYDIDTLFSVVMPTSSLNYIRNYNFNSTTVSSLPMTLINSGSEIPITVNITTTVPWIQITDPATGANLKYPDGNVVLPPTSSKLVYVKIDLPPDIEDITNTTVRPNILLEAKSGSFAIVPPPVTPTTPTTPTSPTGDDKGGIVAATTDINIIEGEQFLVQYTVYGKDGKPDFEVTIDEITFEYDSQVIAINRNEEMVSSYSPIYVQGVSNGTTQIVIKAKGYETTIQVTVRAESKLPIEDGTPTF